MHKQVRGRLTVQSLEGTHRYRGIMHATSVIVREVRPHSTRIPIVVLETSVLSLPHCHGLRGRQFHSMVVPSPLQKSGATNGKVPHGPILVMSPSRVRVSMGFHGSTK